MRNIVKKYTTLILLILLFLMSGCVDLAKYQEPIKKCSESGEEAMNSAKEYFLLANELENNGRILEIAKELSMETNKGIGLTSEASELLIEYHEFNDEVLNSLSNIFLNKKDKISKLKNLNRGSRIILTFFHVKHSFPVIMPLLASKKIISFV